MKSIELRCFHCSLCLPYTMHVGEMYYVSAKHCALNHLVMLPIVMRIDKTNGKVEYSPSNGISEIALI